MPTKTFRPSDEPRGKRQVSQIPFVEKTFVDLKPISRINRLLYLRRVEPVEPNFAPQRGDVRRVLVQDCTTSNRTEVLAFLSESFQGSSFELT